MTFDDISYVYISIHLLVLAAKTGTFCWNDDENYLFLCLLVCLTCIGGLSEKKSSYINDDKSNESISKEVCYFACEMM